MSEPIELYDVDANPVTMYAPMTAAELVKQGVLFECPPMLVEVEKTSPPKATKKAPVKKKA